MLHKLKCIKIIVHDTAISVGSDKQLDRLIGMFAGDFICLCRVVNMTGWSFRFCQFEIQNGGCIEPNNGFILSNHSRERVNNLRNVTRVPSVGCPG